jgi:sugar phosphate isomerase/epimerase
MKISSRHTGRRTFLQRAALLAGTGFGLSHALRGAGSPAGQRLKLSLNAFSFDQPLRAGSMDLMQLLDYCSDHGFDAIDPTGYYFPGYPAPPPEEYLYNFKRRASRLGLDISGTGIRNDFTQPDPSRRASDLLMLSEWVEASSRMGAPLIRVFAGHTMPGIHSREEITAWLIESLKTAADIGRSRGVMIALQNHDDFLKSDREVLHVLESVGSDWLGLHLDIGSLTSEDPYREIERLIPYAINWQIKEFVRPLGVPQPTDYRRLMDIIRRSDYRGYLPLETLGEGAPERVPAMLAAVRAVMP